MLVINTEVKKSALHGLGLFTQENLSAGQLIWVFHPNLDRLLSIQEWREHTSLIKQFLHTYMYWSKTQQKYVICLDNARFMNHSKKANTHGVFFESIDNIPLDIREKTMMSSEQWAHIDMREGFTVASRDIYAQEELCCDYNRDFPDQGGAHNQGFIF